MRIIIGKTIYNIACRTLYSKLRVLAYNVLRYKNKIEARHATSTTTTTYNIYVDVHVHVDVDVDVDVERERLN